MTNFQTTYNRMTLETTREQVNIIVNWEDDRDLVMSCSQLTLQASGSYNCYVFAWQIRASRSKAHNINLKLIITSIERLTYRKQPQSPLTYSCATHTRAVDVVVHWAWDQTHHCVVSFYLWELCDDLMPEWQAVLTCGRLQMTLQIYTRTTAHPGLKIFVSRRSKKFQMGSALGPWSESCACTRNTGNGFRGRGVIVDDSIGPCPGDGIGADIRNVTGNGVSMASRHGKAEKRGRVGHVVELLEMMILCTEFVKEVFSGVFLKSLRKESCSERVRRDEKGTDLQEIGVDLGPGHPWTPICRTFHGWSWRKGQRWGKECIAGRARGERGGCAVAVGVHVRGREGIGQAHVGGSDWGGWGRGGGAVGIAIEGLWQMVVVVVEIVLWVVGVHIEDANANADADASLCEVSADGDICAGDNGEGVDTGRETTDGGDLVGGEGGSAQIGMGCDGGFEDHGIRTRWRETVGACTWTERGHSGWGLGIDRGTMWSRFEKVNAAVRGGASTGWVRGEG